MTSSTRPTSGCRSSTLMTGCCHLDRIVSMNQSGPCRSDRKESPMAWDFETDPEYQEKLDWVDEFVREEVEPLDLALPCTSSSLPPDASSGRSIDPLKEQVRRPGPVGHPPRARSWAARATGSSSWRCSTRSWAGRSWAPSSSAARRPTPATRRSSRHYGTDEQKERYLKPLLNGEMLLVLLDDRAAGRLRPDAVQDPGRQGRRRVGDQRLEVLLLQRQAPPRSSSSWR